MVRWGSQPQATDATSNNDDISINGCQSIDCLDDDSLGAVFQQFPLSFRVGVISLVCKNWQRVQHEHPLRPKHLAMSAMHFSAALRAGRIRDASKLQTMEVLEEPDEDPVLSGAHGEALNKLLAHLASHAPALCSLSIRNNHPWWYYNDLIHTSLPLISNLSRLQCLTLENWSYELEHAAKLCSILAGLHNLEALSMRNILGTANDYGGDLTVAEYNEMTADERDDLKEMDSIIRASSAMQKAVCALSRLTRLEIEDVDLFARQYMVPFSAADLAGLANLRSLTCHFREKFQYTSAPLSAQMTKLTSLSVPWGEGVLVRDMVASQDNLKELHILNMEKTSTPLSISSAAQLTKLRIRAIPGLSGMDEYLPIQGLDSLKELAVDAFYIGNDDLFPSWSASSNLSQLTGLTGLTLKHCTMYARYYDGLAYADVVKAGKNCVKVALYTLPQHMLGLKSLVEVELKGDIDHVVFWCQRYLEDILSLPQLDKMQFGFRDATADYPFSKVLQLDRLCQQAECAVVSKGVLNCLYFTLEFFDWNDLAIEEPTHGWKAGRVIIALMGRNL